MSARVRVITGWTAQARWLAQVEDGPRILRPAGLPRTPYAYSEDLATYVDEHGRSVVLLEVSHRRFEVWTVAVPLGAPMPGCACGRGLVRSVGVEGVDGCERHTVAECYTWQHGRPEPLEGSPEDPAAVEGGAL